MITIYDFTIYDLRFEEANTIMQLQAQLYLENSFFKKTTFYNGMPLQQAAAKVI